MAQLKLTVKTVTPLLMNGAGGKPELRAASFRGVLRYWLRALLGAKYPENTQALFEEESRYWGSTSRGSAINLRVIGRLKRGTEQLDNVVLPSRLRFEHFSAGQEFLLLLSTHPLQNPNMVFTSQLYSSLLLACTLGGFGKRARRGGGHIQIERFQSNWASESMTEHERFGLLVDSLKTQPPNVAISEVLKYADPNTSLSSIPAYPTVDAENCVVLIGKDGDANHIQTLERVWKIAKNYAHTDAKIRMYDRKNKRPDGVHIIDRWWAWGFAKPSLHRNDSDSRNKAKSLVPARGEKPYEDGGRRASNVHITVHSYQNRFYPVVTIFRSLPDYDHYHSGEPSSWQLFADFADELTDNGFDAVFGTWEHWA